MKVYKIQDVRTKKWCLAGCRTTNGNGKTWSTLALAKAAITSSWQHRGRWSQGNPTKQEWAKKFYVVEYELVEVQSYPARRYI